MYVCTYVCVCRIHFEVRDMTSFKLTQQKICGLHIFICVSAFCCGGQSIDLPHRPTESCHCN